MLEMDSNLQAQINKIAKDGDAQANKGNWAGQIEKYREIWDLIPEPKHEWDGGTWILGGIAEAYFQMKELESAKQFFNQSLKCHRGEENSFLHLRLGEINFDEKNLERARIHLKKAWDLSEGRAFAGEPKRYRDFLLNSSS